MSPENPNYVTPRELYDKVGAVEAKLEEKIDANHESVSKDLTKFKVAFAVIFILLASPKAGGPSADQLVAGAFKVFGG